MKYTELRKPTSVTRSIGPISSRRLLTCGGSGCHLVEIGATSRGGLGVGFVRMVVSETEAPILFVNMV
jgi:hypothetical protein